MDVGRRRMRIVPIDELDRRGPPRSCGEAEDYLKVSKIEVHSKHHRKAPQSLIHVGAGERKVPQLMRGAVRWFPLEAACEIFCLGKTSASLRSSSGVVETYPGPAIRTCLRHLCQITRSTAVSHCLLTTFASISSLRSSSGVKEKLNALPIKLKIA